MITDCQLSRSCSRHLNLSARRAKEREIDARSLKIDNSAARCTTVKRSRKKYDGTFSRAGFRRTIPSPTVRFGSPRIVHESLMMATSLSYLTILITITHARRTAHCVPPPTGPPALPFPSAPFAPSSDYSFQASTHVRVPDRKIMPREAGNARCEA